MWSIVACVCIQFFLSAFAVIFICVLFLFLKDSILNHRGLYTSVIVWALVLITLSLCFRSSVDRLQNVLQRPRRLVYGIRGEEQSQGFENDSRGV